MKKIDDRNVRAVALAAAMLAMAAVATCPSSARADQIDCTLDGYVAMGGMVWNTGNAYMLPGNPDSPPSGPMATFGYGFLKFDAADLPAEALDPATHQATLTMEVMALQDGMSYPVMGTGSVGAYAVTADVAGITDAATADSFRSSIADAAADSVSVTADTAESFSEMISLDVTDIVNGWITSGNNYGLVLASPGGLILRTHATESTTGAAPVITTSAIPEPGTMMLLLLAVGLLIGMRRR